MFVKTAQRLASLFIKKGSGVHVPLVEEEH